MDKKSLFAYLGKQSKASLIDFLDAAYELLTVNQRHAVFGRAIPKARPRVVEGEALVKEVKAFHRESLAGEYYAPFDVNSKNFMHVPEETEAWFERLGDLLDDSVRLSKGKDHAHAVACFRLLHELIEKMNHGEEIVFAEECGDWMIPGDSKVRVAAYLKSLAATSTPAEYAAAAVPMIREDSQYSSRDRVFDAAMKAADKEQTAHLKAEIKRLRIRTRAAEDEG